MIQIGIVICIVIFLNQIACKREKDEFAYTPPPVMLVEKCPLDDETCLEFHNVSVSQNLNEKQSIKKLVKTLNKILENYFVPENFDGNEFYVFADAQVPLGVSLYTRKNIKKGDVLVKLEPFSQTLNFKSNEQGNFALMDRKIMNLQATPLQIKNLEDLLAINLIYHAVWVQDSNFEDYLMSLPREVNCPLIELTKEEMELLQLTPTGNKEAYNYVQKIRKAINNAYFNTVSQIQDQWMNAHERLFYDYFRRRHVSMSDFVWAKYIILTRGLIDQKRYLFTIVPPIFDIIQPQIVLKIEQYMEGPYVEYNDLKDSKYPFYIYSDRDLKAGERVENNFLLKGLNMNNLLMLLTFGYIPKINYNECLNLDIQMPQYQMSRSKQFREILNELNVLGRVCVHPDDYTNDKFLIALLFDNIADETIAEIYKIYYPYILKRETSASIEPISERINLLIEQIQKNVQGKIEIKIDFREKIVAFLEKYKADYKNQLDNVNKFKQENQDVISKFKYIDLIEKYYKNQIDFANRLIEFFNNLLQKFQELVPIQQSNTKNDL